MIYIEANNISYSYDHEEVLSHVDLKLHDGEFVTLTGENGAAKSTLIKILLGLKKPDSGEVVHAPENINGRPLKIAYLPQHLDAMNSGFPSSVLEFVKSGIDDIRNPVPKNSFEYLQMIKSAIARFGLNDFVDFKIGELSGGLKQRANLARITLMDADVLVLDEPSTGLDINSRISLYHYLNKIVTEQRKSVLMITHDNTEFSTFVDRNLHLVKNEKLHETIYGKAGK